MSIDGRKCEVVTEFKLNQQRDTKVIQVGTPLAFMCTFIFIACTYYKLNKYSRLLGRVNGLCI